MSTQLKATIYLLRHGEPVGGQRYRGSTNDPLSDRGWIQMHQAIHSYPHWQQIISSPLSRCADFARQLSDSLQIPLQQENDFSEIDFGDWEGRTADELWRQDPEYFGNYLSDPLSYTPPQGESLLKFSQRVLSAWDKLSLNTSNHDNILLIAHGGTIRVLLHHLLGIPLTSIMKIHVPFACLSKIMLSYSDHYPVEYRLAFHGISNRLTP